MKPFLLVTALILFMALGVVMFVDEHVKTVDEVKCEHGFTCSQ